MNQPLYYNLFLVHCNCSNCGEEYLYNDVQMARDIPKGVAYSPPKADAPVYDIPVNKIEVNRPVPFCSMCIDGIEKTPWVNLDNKRVVGLAKDQEDGKVTVELDLVALGLI